MNRQRKILDMRLRGRSGLTLVEVILALAIFLVGSLGIMGLFVAAGVLHSEAVNRRTASYIAAELLAELNAQRMREVFAKTRLDGPYNAGDPSMQVDDVEPGPGAVAADFDDRGPLLVGGQWYWYGRVSPVTPQFMGVSIPANWPVPSPAPSHSDGARVLQPLTWDFVLDADIAQDLVPADRNTGEPTSAITLDVRWTEDPDGWADFYVVVDDEWMKVNNVTSGASTAQFEVESDMRRVGQDDDAAVEHKAGTPVTIAREHPRYPGYYYAVQIYPTNARGALAEVLVSVAYGSENRFRVQSFRSSYSPRQL